MCYIYKEKEVREKEIIQRQKDLCCQMPTLPLKERRDALLRLRTVVQKRQSDIEQALKADLGKSDAESYMTETGMVLTEINYALRHLKRWSKEKKVRSHISLFPSKARIVAEAYGVVFIIAPWNYPVQLALSPLVGAIAAGNRVVLNPSPLSQNTTKLLQELINENFSPELAYCFSGEISLTTELIEQKPDYIFFTGSPATARIISAQASRHLIPLTLELGGKSPVIIDQDADLEIAVKRIALGKFINGGQTCIAPDYVFVHKKLKQRFVELFRRFIFPKQPFDTTETAFQYRIINSRHFQRLKGLLGNQNIILGGELREQENYISPTLVEEPSLQSPIMREEIFGPILPILSFDSIEEPIRYIQSQPKPLALYYFGKQNKDIIRKTTSGGACINDTIMHILPIRLPFGGVGESGMGNYHGKASFDTFTHYKSVLHSHPHFDLSVKYPPYSAKAKRLFERLIK